MSKFTLQAFHQLQVLTACIQMQHYVKYLVKYFVEVSANWSKIRLRCKGGNLQLMLGVQNWHEVLKIIFGPPPQKKNWVFEGCCSKMLCAIPWTYFCALSPLNLAYHDYNVPTDLRGAWSKRRQTKPAKVKTATPKRRQSKTATG